MKYAYFFDNISVLSKQVCSKLIIVFTPGYYTERYIYRKLNLKGGAPHESSISRALKQARKLKLHRLLPL